MSPLEIIDMPVSRQIEKVEKGFPGTILSKMVKYIDLPEIIIIDGLKLPRRTMTERKKPGARFSMMESERLLRVMRIHKAAQEVFASNMAIAGWLKEPDRALGMKTPLEMLATDLGTAKVDNLIKAMVHGVPV
ncbi:MAG TPA: antitoxin Xre/MbcA/ParS toxin-binding domain-containing protein [Opitutaceae bacterium]|jgi:putative toxin-antitoxin system antitoxin component (TIGR02293 family)